MSFDLNKHLAYLLLNEPFFAALSRRVEKKQDRSIPTAGVCLNKDHQRFELLYNPDFFESLPENQRLGVLKHEFYHLIFDHVTSRKPEGVPHQRWNIAADLAINSHLVGELPEGCCMPGEAPFEDLPAGMSAEWYLANLPESPEGEGDGEGQPGQGEAGEGEGKPSPGNFDDHSGWEEAPSPEAQIAKERMKDAVKKAAAEAAKGNSWGSVSGDVKKEILKRLETKVDWKKVLRYFIKTSQRASRSSSVKRINRRYAYIHPGKRVKRQAKIAIAIDQSGSVSDEMLQAFFGELNKLAKLAEFTVVPFDTHVDDSKVYVWKKGDNKKAERVLCGGTCFDAPTDWANQNGVDGLIVLTDMEAPQPKACKAQRMWMTDERGASRPYFKTNERVIQID